MFKNKYLKQLQDVQARIRDCRAMKAKMNPPRPHSSKIERNVIYWLELIVYGQDTNLDKLCEICFKSSEVETVEYIHRLGEYFVDIAKYYKTTKEYDMELNRLLKEAHDLKVKLGIE